MDFHPLHRQCYSCTGVYYHEALCCLPITLQLATPHNLQRHCTYRQVQVVLLLSLDLTQLEPWLFDLEFTRWQANLLDHQGMQ